MNESLMINTILFSLLQLCLGLARLLQYLAQSPIGSLFIRDFKLSQFVLVDGEIKLTDLDDVDNEEPRCLTNRDCVVRRTIGVNKTLQCNQGRCKNLIAAVNLDNIGGYFFNHVLVPGSPEYLKEYLNEIKYNVQQLTWNSEALVWHMERVLYLLRSGKHLGKFLLQFWEAPAVVEFIYQFMPLLWSIRDISRYINLQL